MVQLRFCHLGRVATWEVWFYLCNNTNLLNLHLILKRKIPITFASKVHLELKNETRIQLWNANFWFDLQRRILEQLSNVNYKICILGCICLSVNSTTKGNVNKQISILNSFNMLWNTYFLIIINEHINQRISNRKCEKYPLVKANANNLKLL